MDTFCHSVGIWVKAVLSESQAGPTKLVAVIRIIITQNGMVLWVYMRENEGMTSGMTFHRQREDSTKSIVLHVFHQCGTSFLWIGMQEAFISAYILFFLLHFFKNAWNMFRFVRFYWRLHMSHVNKLWICCMTMNNSLDASVSRAFRKLGGLLNQFMNQFEESVNDFINIMILLK